MTDSISVQCRATHPALRIELADGSVIHPVAGGTYEVAERMLEGLLKRGFVEYDPPVLPGPKLPEVDESDEG